MHRSPLRILFICLALCAIAWIAVSRVHDEPAVLATREPEGAMLIKIALLYAAYLCVLLGIDQNPAETDSQ